MELMAVPELVEPKAARSEINTIVAMEIVEGQAPNDLPVAELAEARDRSALPTGG